MDQLRIRSLRDTDIPFIISSWLGSHYSKMISWRPERSEYFKTHQLLVKEAILEDATLVACNASDEDHIIGWINFGDDYLNYVFVKETFEGMGVAQALISQTGLVNDLVCTHFTKLFHVKLFKKYNATFNPYLFTNRRLNHEEIESSLFRATS